MKLKMTLSVLMPFLLSAGLAEARVRQIVFDRVESPAFDGMSFGDVGQYERIFGRAFGEIDPRARPFVDGDEQDGDHHHHRRSIVTDLELAPRNHRGMVEYVSDFVLIKPIDMARANGVMRYNVPNRGNAALTGDAFLQARGYVLLDSGCQGDVPRVNQRLSIDVPVARNRDGSEITSEILTEFIVDSPNTTQNIGLDSVSYETVSLDTSMASLTRRVREADPREPVPDGDWAFADCSDTPFPGAPSTTSICLREGFDPNYIYELIYTAKNPLVLGMGFPATRDVVSFFRHQARDEAGTPNPVANAIRHVIAFGGSQSGTFLMAMLHLGFNQDERGRRVFDGVRSIVGVQTLPLNVRFGQPTRIVAQHENHLFPRNQAPFNLLPVYDPIARRTAGRLTRCLESRSCPKLVMETTGTEYWQYHGSGVTTDALGRRDLFLPSNLVRFYHLSGAAHAGSLAFADCQFSSGQNFNSVAELRQALVVNLEKWVVDGIPPPESQYPKVQQGLLVPPNEVNWPAIPGMTFTGLAASVPLLDFGPEFRAADESGIISNSPPVIRGEYPVLVPQVDEDGNEIGGVRSTSILAPIATYTGWNYRRAGFAEGELCSLFGATFPFARTRAKRQMSGDPRLSLEERYGTHQGYVTAVRAAAERLVAEGYLLSQDADAIVAAADASDVLR